MLRVIRTASLLVVAILSTVALSWSRVTFTQTAVNSGDTSSTSIATGDFDNDSILDLVTVNGSSLSFYKGLGDATYAAPVNQVLPQSLGQAFAADFNRDSNLDLAISSIPYGGPAGVTILLGNGDGTFRQGTNIPVDGNAGFITLADFNGDHLPDIAASCNSTEVFLGQGEGTFQLSSTLSSSGGQIVAGDFNADGLQDLAVVAGNGIVLYLGKGQGTFGSPLPAHLPDVASIAVGDFFNNRIQSLVALVSIFTGGGDFANYLYSLRYSNGQWLVEKRNMVSPQTGDPYQQIIAGDLDGNFKDDVFLVGGNVTGSAVSAYMLGNGDGTFGAPADAPHWLDLQFFPFLRDLDGDSRHDVGIAWSSIFEDIGGAEALRNTSAAVNCRPPKPDTLDAHICAPREGQQVGHTFTFRGAGNAFSGYPKRMELWIDGTKIAQNLEDQLKATVSLARGSHTASFVVVDSFDSYVTESVSFESSY